MKHLFIFFALMLTLVGCGGGGGGAAITYTVTGVVKWLPTNAPPNPSATVISSLASVATNASDGSFVISAPSGTTSLLVTFTPVGQAPIAFTFRFAALAGNTDLGELFLANQKVSLRGRVVASDTGGGISGARISFAGQQVLTDSSGNYDLLDVAYDPAALANFQSITGRASANAYLAATFGAASAPVGGVVAMDDIALIPQSSDTPPGVPGNIYGSVTPAVSAVGTTVVLYFNAIPVRQFTVGTDRQYYFWVLPGTYSLRATQGSLTVPDTAVTLSFIQAPVKKDLVLR